MEGRKPDMCQLNHVSSITWLPLCMMIVSRMSVFIATLLFVLHGIVPHVHGAETTSETPQWRSAEGLHQHLFSADLGAHHLEFALNDADHDLQVGGCETLTTQHFYNEVGFVCTGSALLPVRKAPTSDLRPGHGRAFALRPPPVK